MPLKLDLLPDKPETPKMKTKSNIPDMPPSMVGKYIQSMGYKPDKEGLTLIPQEIADLITQVRGYTGIGFSLDPWAYRLLGLPSNYNIFIENPRL